MTAAPAFFAAIAMGEAPGTPSAIIDMRAIYGGLVLPLSILERAERIVA
jgi:hypothetical protein